MAISLVSSTIANFASASSGIVPLNGNNTFINNLTIVIDVHFPNITSAVTSITDGNNNVYASRVVDNGTVDRVEIWSTAAGAGTGVNGANTLSITVNFSGATKFVAGAISWTGPTALGHTATNSGTSTTPSVALVLQDPNNVSQGCFSWQGLGTATANQGTLRNQVNTTGGAASSNVGGANVFNTSASVGSITDSITITSAAWAAAALELRQPQAAVVPVWNMPFLPGFGNGR